MKNSALGFSLAFLLGLVAAVPNQLAHASRPQKLFQQAPPHGKPLPNGGHLEPDGHTSGGVNPTSPTTPPHHGYPVLPGPSGTVALPPQPGALDGIDLTGWKLWWFFNRENLLDLRRRFDEAGLVTGKTSNKPIGTRPSDKELQEIVLPALFAMVDKKQQDNVRASAAIALARIATPESGSIAGALKGLVQDRDPSLREAASLALGINGDPQFIESLTTILNGGVQAKSLLGYKPNDRMRAFAAYGLALLADRAQNDDIQRVALRPVLERFLDTKERDDLRVALASALGMMQIEFEPQGFPAAKQPQQTKALLRHRGELIDTLWEAYDNEREPLVRGHLPNAIARLLQDAPLSIRALGISRFLALLDDDPNPWELYGLISALGIVGQAWGQPADHSLRQALYAQATDQRESHARRLAMMALARVVANSGPSLPPKGVQEEFESFLQTRFKKGRKADRPWVAMAAGRFGARLRTPVSGRKGARSKGRVGAEIVGLLRKVVRSGGSPDELSAAVVALGLIQDPAAGEDLERLLDSTPSKTIRGYVALSLGLLGRTSAFGKLAAQIDDLRYEPVALENAAIGLALLNRTKASELLTDRLATAYSGFTAAPLAAALGRVSDSSSISLLAAVTQEPFQTLATRQFACTALGLISDRDDLSWRANLASDVNYAAWTPTLFDSAGQGVFNLD